MGRARNKEQVFREMANFPQLWNFWMLIFIFDEKEWFLNKQARHAYFNTYFCYFISENLHSC